MKTNDQQLINEAIQIMVKNHSIEFAREKAKALIAGKLVDLYLHLIKKMHGVR